MNNTDKYKILLADDKPQNIRLFYAGNEIKYECFR